MVSGSRGLGDSDETRALQRATPSLEALEWVVAVAGARSVEAVEPIPGGASLAMHRVRVSFADGGSATLVLRRFVRPDQIAEDSGVAKHEAAVLELVERVATPTPRLIGVDASGDLVGTPAVLMTEFPGKPAWTTNLRWMRQLVEVLVDVHAIDAATAWMVRPFNVYAQQSYALPKWVTKPAMWERAIEVFHGPVPDQDRTFIHRDFYPGNVLWHRRAVSDQLLLSALLEALCPDRSAILAGEPSRRSQDARMAATRSRRRRQPTRCWTRRVDPTPR